MSAALTALVRRLRALGRVSVFWVVEIQLMEMSQIFNGLREHLLV